MLKKLMITTFSIAALAGASTAFAATYNFVTLIDGAGGTGEGTWIDKANAGPIVAGVWTVDSIGVSASASAVSTTTAGPFAYLDGDGAGLGVCSISNCAGSSDDNTGIAGDSADGASANFETLILTFDTVVKLDSLAFRDRGHAVHTDDFSLEINGLLWSPGDTLAGIAASNTYRFERIYDANKTKNQLDFYLDTAAVTAVPIPAAAWLFGSALIGLAGVARKRKMS